MNFIDWLLGTPLGAVLSWCYQLVKNYGLAIIAFTLVTKVILFPLSMLAQKNAIVMARLKPQLDDIKRRFEGNPSLMLEEQQKLYKDNHYSAIKGSAPLLVQIPLILGVIAVVYHPLKHVLKLSGPTISSLIDKAASILGMSASDLGYSGETRVLQLVQQDPSAFAQAASSTDIAAIEAVHLNFLGLNLADIPSWTSVTIIWPILSALSALALCLYQNRYYVLQKFAGWGSRVGMTIFMVLFAGYFALILPGAFGLYWTVGNLFSIGVVWLCNVIDDPRKKIDYASLAVHKVKLTREQKATQRADKKAASAKSRVDTKRFRQTHGKQLMIYSEGSGYYKYFSGVIEALKGSGITIHYVTSDFHDRVFDMQNDQLETYYVSGRALIPFMMQLDVDIALMTMPDLETFHIKRSLVRHDIEYIYLDHGMTSFHLMLREHALDHFDTVFCYGPNHVEEVRETEVAYELPSKRLVNTGYPLLDDMLASVAGQGVHRNDPPVVLIAPSWQPQNLLEICAEDTVRPLINAGFHVVIRPHPEFVKRFTERMAGLQETFHPDVESGHLEIQTDFSSSSTVYNADVIVTDWSTIAQEFSYTTKKPSIFINTPMKVMNYNWKAIEAVPLDISLRDEIGVSIDVDKLDTIADVAREFVDHPQAWTQRIEKVMDDNLFNIGHAGQACADYITSSLEEKSHERALMDAEDAVDAGTATAEQEALIEAEAARLERKKITELRAQADEMAAMASQLRAQADDLAKVSVTSTDV